MKVVLSTDRLNIREASLDDAAFVLKILNDDAWLKYIGDRNVRTLEDAKNYISSSLISGYQKNGYGMYVVEDKTSSTSLGFCGLVNRPTLENIDIGFAFLTEHCGMGYGYESSKAVLHYALNDLNIKKIVAITLEKNSRSRKLLEKIGLSFEKFIQGGNGEELMMYSIGSSV